MIGSGAHQSNWFEYDQETRDSYISFKPTSNGGYEGQEAMGMADTRYASLSKDMQEIEKRHELNGCDINMRPMVDSNFNSFKPPGQNNRGNLEKSFANNDQMSTSSSCGGVGGAHRSKLAKYDQEILKVFRKLILTFPEHKKDGFQTNFCLLLYMLRSLTFQILK